MQFCAEHEIPILHTDSDRRGTYLTKGFLFLCVAMFSDDVQLKSCRAKAEECERVAKIAGSAGIADLFRQQLPVQSLIQIGTLPHRGWGLMNQDSVLALIGKVADVVPMIASGIGIWRDTGGWPIWRDA
jgi:hypothetical protein